MLEYLKNGRTKKIIASFAFVGTFLSASLQGYALANYFIGGDVYSPVSNIKELTQKFGLPPMLLSLRDR